MLIKFAVTNFRGFAERIEWDLSSPSNYGFNQYAIKNDAIKNGIVFGPNGSGKTNFSLAIFDIVNHLSQNWKKLDYYDNFAYAGSTGLVSFEYAFRFDKTVVEYKYAKNPNGFLIEESLKADKKTIFSRRPGEFDISNGEFTMDPKVIKSLAQSDNHVSIVNFLLTSYPLKSSHYLMRLKRFADSMLWFRNLDVREFMGLETNVTNIDEYIISNGLLEDFSDFLRRVSGQEFDFEIVSHNSSDRQLLCKIGGGKVLFSRIASTGTRSLQLLYFWLKRMNEASFVFIDEFDAFYHYDLSFEVCKILFAMDCQVFTSSHNTYLMTNELLRPDCLFVLNGNKIKCLADCTDKELRFGHNIEKIYRSGAFNQ